MSSSQSELSGTPLQKAIRRPSTFLSLAPVHSESFPKKPVSPNASEKSPVTEAIATTVAIEPVTEPKPLSTASRRHSSTSSVGSVRFLRLGPVHWGGDGGDDYAVEE